MLTRFNQVLGMNARSAYYLRTNKKNARDTADDKLRTKQILKKNGIPTAELITVVRNRAEALAYDWSSLPASFVIKPNRGLGGAGILVVFNKLKSGKWLTTGKRELTEEDFLAHVLNILDGNYSLLNTPDIALFESRLSVDPLYKAFASEGIPDIRVIVFNTVPVMAMVRVPTKKSAGKANLAQGGLGIGVDITTGLTTHVIMKSWLYEKEIDRHPDTQLYLRGIKLPYWNDILKIAVLAARVTGLQYAGVDISIDKKLGPVVLELNARPGFGIQIANMAPLRERLQRLRGLKVETPERGISIAKELFAGQFDAEITRMTGRNIIGLIEPVTVFGKEKEMKNIRAKIDTGADNSSIDAALARSLGFGEALDVFEAHHIVQPTTEEEATTLAQSLEDGMKKQHPDIRGLAIVKSSNGITLRLQITMAVQLAGHRIDIEPTVIDRSHLKYPILIGKRNLSHFLIDTTKVIPKTKEEARRASKNGAATSTAIGI